MGPSPPDLYSQRIAMGKRTVTKRTVNLERKELASDIGEISVATPVVE